MLLIKNAKILDFPSERNILVEDGKIMEITAPSLSKQADEVIDARGCYALPGAIDMHVHCREPGSTNKEDFQSASMAAAAGGVTTIVDMPNNNPPIITIERLEEKRELASSKCVVNFGFHFGATPDNIEEIKKATNIAAVKVYMGSSTGSLLVAEDADLQRIFASGKRIAVHAENEKMIQENTKKFKAKPHNFAALDHLSIRNNQVAAIEVERAISIAQENKARLHICHTSTSEELTIIRENKHLMSLSCEVTPHHLFLPVEDSVELKNYAKVNPPLRHKADVAALWDALSDGTIDMISTDHAPHEQSEKEADYEHAPSGIPGLDTMMPLLIDSVNKSRISLQQLVRLTSSNPASVFSIQGKGKIESGFDADIILMDVKKEYVIKELKTRCQWSPFAGRELKGKIEKTIVNGNLVYEDDVVIKHILGKEVTFR